MARTRLHELFDEQGQSPWLDNLKRGYLKDGQLQRLVDEGIRGVTSNPTIFQKAISGSADYDDQFRELATATTVENSYWEMVIQDITDALGVLRPVYDSSGGADGFVSLEVAPSLATDTRGTADAARSLHERIALPNLMVKIPATKEGVPAIQAMIAEGRNINITLIFSLTRYADVIEAYIAGLEQLDKASGDLANVHSVASFFVSRVDTEVDRRLDAIGTDEAKAARGKAAVAQAKLAYQLFQEKFSGPRWEALAKKGAHKQRPLWASTSTKNKAYSDLLYVNSLIGPDSVNTLPDPTIEAFVDHGVVARTVDQDVDQAERDFEELDRLGIDVEDVARTLEEEGVSSFAKSFDELVQALTDKANELTGGQATNA
ncbi:MAG: transaldolase [Acidimicrobiaceae bacterium]|jgi:transaldolase|nr:transaldolase [Acidimicrobiaceae bacterium]